MIGYFHSGSLTWKLVEILLLTSSTDKIFSALLIYGLEMENQRVVLRELVKWKLELWGYKDQEKSQIHLKEFKLVVDWQISVFVPRFYFRKIIWI